MTVPLRPRHLAAAVPLVAGLLLAALLVAVPAAGAHCGAGQIEVVSTAPEDGTTVRVDARVTYVSDGHPAEGARVTVSGTGPDGQVVAEQPLEPTDEVGRFTSLVVFPATGDWTLHLASTFPPAELDQAIVVDVPATTSPTAAPTTVAELEEVAAGGDAGSGSGLSAGAVVGIVVAVVVVAALVVVGVVRWRRADAQPSGLE